MDQHPEQKFSAWAASKPFAVGALARFAVETIGPLREFMEYRQTSAGPFALEPPTDLDAWLSFYRRKTLVGSFCGSLFGEPRIARRAYRIYRAPGSPAAATPVELFSAFLVILSAFVDHDIIKEQSCSIAEQIDAAIGDECLESIMAFPIMQFAL